MPRSHLYRFQYRKNLGVMLRKFCKKMLLSKSVTKLEDLTVTSKKKWIRRMTYLVPSHRHLWKGASTTSLRQMLWSWWEPCWRGRLRSTWATGRSWVRNSSPSSSSSLPRQSPPVLLWRGSSARARTSWRQRLPPWLMTPRDAHVYERLQT